MDLERGRIEVHESHGDVPMGGHERVAQGGCHLVVKFGCSSRGVLPPAGQADCEAASQHVSSAGVAAVATVVPKWSWSMSEKDEKARELVEWHFEVEPDLVEVFRIMSDDEANPAEPIKLLEVNEATMPTGEITAFGFGASKDFPFRTIIAEVTPKEFAALKSSLGVFPNGWRLDTAIRFTRPLAA